MAPERHVSMTETSLPWCRNEPRPFTLQYLFGFTILSIYTGSLPALTTHLRVFFGVWVLASVFVYLMPQLFGFFLVAHWVQPWVAMSGRA